MWNELSEIWQAAFREAWEAFVQGSPPIGAVLCDSEGRIIMCEHNRNNEPHIPNKRLAHAEAGILRRLDTSEYDPKKLADGTCVDRLSLALALQNDKDERTEEAVEEMLAQVWRDMNGKRNG